MPRDTILKPSSLCWRRSKPSWCQLALYEVGDEPVRVRVGVCLTVSYVSCSHWTSRCHWSFCFHPLCLVAFSPTVSPCFLGWRIAQWVRGAACMLYSLVVNVRLAGDKPHPLFNVYCFFFISYCLLFIVFPWFRFTPLLLCLIVLHILMVLVFPSGNPQCLLCLLISVFALFLCFCVYLLLLSPPAVHGPAPSSIAWFGYD